MAAIAATYPLRSSVCPFPGHEMTPPGRYDTMPVDNGFDRLLPHLTE